MARGIYCGQGPLRSAVREGSASVRKRDEDVRSELAKGQPEETREEGQVCAEAATNGVRAVCGRAPSLGRRSGWRLAPGMHA